MGNFSVPNGTFDALKHYVGVRLQQGVPIIDADWNEMEDIRRYEIESFLRHFVGDGVPKGSDGFCITPATEKIIKLEGGIRSGGISIPGGKASTNTATHYVANDFVIADGWCLVNGWQVKNNYAAEHIITDHLALEHLPLRYSRQTSTDSLPSLTTPTEDRTDLVYLDIWEYEVNDKDNPVYKLIGISSCTRLRREWLVRVAERVDDLAEVEKLNGHVYYPLALLHRSAGNENISNIEDLRRTGVAMLSQPLTIDNGNIGIGTTTPVAKLTIDPHGQGGIVIGKFDIGYTHLNIGISAERGGYSSLQSVKSRGSAYGDISLNPDGGKVGIGTSNVAQDAKLHIEQAINGDLNLLLKNTHGEGARTYLTAALGKSLIQTDKDFAISTNGGGDWSDKLTVKNNGNVGIGTTEPQGRLTIKGTNPHHGHFSFFTPTTDIAYDGGDDGLFIFNHEHPNGKTAFLGGNVGIGTTEPGEKLEVNGRVKCQNVRIQLVDTWEIATQTTTWAEMMSKKVETGKGPVLALFKAGAVLFPAQDTGSTGARFRLLIDNRCVAQSRYSFNLSGHHVIDTNLMALEDLEAGEHTFTVEWKVTDSNHQVNICADSERLSTRHLIIIEL